ncbi:MAG TPA: hypothetical protein DCZ88_16345 [Pseudanabaena sp.]|nr:hypothetical protein [Pseudanabaena sp.]
MCKTPRKLCCLSDKKSHYRLIFIQQQHEACQKGIPPLDSPVTNFGIIFAAAFVERASKHGK